MVITSSTHWSLSLMGSMNIVLVSSSHPSSASSSSSSCVTSKPGLKSCHLNGLSLPHHDLPSTSSRRLMQTIVLDPPNTTTKPISAGNFRLDEPSSLPIKGDLAFEEKLMPILPWPPIDPIATPKAGKFVDLEGDVTAADVGLLPMPSLVSYASPLYESCFSLSPTDSRMTRISSSESMSTVNSCKSAKMVPNYLGLPSRFFQDVDGKLAKCEGPANFSSVVEKPPISSGEQDLGMQGFSKIGCQLPIGEVLPDFHDTVVGNSTTYLVVNVDEDDNFAESQSLAGLWSNQDVINCDPESMLQYGSESLASILTNLPHNSHEVTSSCPCMTAKSDVENCIGSEFLINELNDLVIPNKGETSFGASADGFQQRVVVSAGNEPLREAFPVEHCKEKAWKSGPNASVITSSYPHFEGKEGSQPFASQHESSQGSRVMAPRISSSAEVNFNAGSYQFNADHSMYSSLLPMKVEKSSCVTDGLGSMIGKKRPFSVFELPCIVSASPGLVNASSNVWASQSDSVAIMQPEKQESKKQELSYSSATQAFSEMLYKSQGGGHSRLMNWATNHDVNDMMKMPPAKARRRHGTAMDPQSIAARTRREKFSDRIRMLQSLVPNGERLDTVSMLGQTLEYVRFLQHQVWQLYHGMDPSNNIKCEKWKDFLEPAQPDSST